MPEQAAAPPASEASFDDIVARYVQIRDAKDALVSAHKTAVAKYDEAMEKIENFLLAHLNAQGSEAVRTNAGTFFKTSKTSATVADWDGLLSWVRENDMWSALDRKVNKTFVVNYRAEHNDLPPGVNYREETVVQIRRA